MRIVPVAALVALVAACSSRRSDAAADPFVLRVSTHVPPLPMSPTAEATLTARAG